MKKTASKRWIIKVLIFLFISTAIIVLTDVIVVSAADDRKESVEADPETVEQEAKRQIMEEFDFSEIDESLRKLSPEQKISFREVTELMTGGNLEEAWKLLLDFFRDQIAYEFRNGRRNLVYMLLLAIVAAVFSNFSGVLANRQASDISFYVLYLLLITLALNTFRVAMGGVEEQLGMILDFMRVLCPGYFLAVTFSSGSSSSVMFYGLVLFLVYVVEALLLRFLLPVIHVYIMVQVMNYLLGEERLSELADLIKKFISWTLKTLLACVIGINVVQGLLGPAIDTLKRNALTKTLEAVPGIGNTFGSVADVVLGAAVLIKNGIGMAGAVILLFLCAMPIVQMAVLSLLYKLTAALVQPVSDKRITGCIRSVSEGYELMLKVVVTIMTLFLLTIAVVATSTS